MPISPKKKYYLAEIELVEEIPGMPEYRAAISVYDVPFEGGDIAYDPVTGIPTQRFTLCLVQTSDHAKIAKDPKIHPLPDVEGLDLGIGSIAKGARDAFFSKLERLGIDTGTINGLTSYRHLVTHLGQKNNPKFDPDKYDLG